MKIVVDDKIPYLEDILEKHFDEVVYLPGKAITTKHVCDADALLIRTRTCCNAELLEGSKVKVIATATIGFDHIDREYCKQKGIAWFNAPGCNAYGVVQYVLAALSLISKNGYGSLSGKTLGIIGVGEVGRRLAAVAPYLGLSVLLNDPPRSRAEGHCGFVDIDTLLRDSDIVTLHVPLIREGIDKTFHLADDRFFEKIGSAKVLINASRGEVVDTAALKNAICKGRIGHAILDVWEHEPDIDQELLAMVDIATPHIAGYSLEGKANGTSMAVNNILRFFGLGDETCWFPSNLPAVNEHVALSKNCTDDEALGEAIMQTYSIKEDDGRLRANPTTFEQLRGCYGVRRELSYFQVEGDVSGLLAERLKGLTFRVK